MLMHGINMAFWCSSEKARGGEFEFFGPSRFHHESQVEEEAYEEVEEEAPKDEAEIKVDDDSPVLVRCRINKNCRFRFSVSVV
ncbi:hypothetical protein AKJ16_DCAP27342 [Drosera capensis]